MTHIGFMEFSGIWSTMCWINFDQMPQLCLFLSSFRETRTSFHPLDVPKYVINMCNEVLGKKVLFKHDPYAESTDQSFYKGINEQFVNNFISITKF